MKTFNQELGERLELLGKESFSLKSIVDYYIKLISETVPSDYCEHFGIGVAVSHNHIGSSWGFYNLHQDCYTVTGSGYYIANDYNCEVKGSTDKQLLDFAKNIQVYIKQGIAELKHNTELMEKLNKKLFFLKEL